MAISGVERVWKTLQNALANGSLSKSVLDSSTAEGMEYTTLALKTAGRAAELIALFKTISVNPNNDRTAEIELAEYLQEVSSLVHSRLIQQGCQLDLVAPVGARICVVPEALTETINLIMMNALDHGFANGRTGTLRLCAHLEPSPAGDDVIIRISDNGHGIAPEDQPKVFDPFFTTKSGIHGHVGLGLHVAYNHVTQRLKGSIHITSELGEGTTVSIRMKRMG
jgi:signal transduction histidine kinase